tara:strand:- start:101069 stop:102013 length:945 start_codon:yes stop_codon:yes gene_type:complete
MKLWVLGTGESIAYHKEELEKLRRSGDKILSFQRTFPLEYKFYNVVPDYWAWMDPNSAAEGLRFLLTVPSTAPQYERLMNIEILVPHFLADNYAYYRLYGGTTPTAPDRVDDEHRTCSWDEYLELLDQVRHIGIKVTVFKATTTKYQQTMGLNTTTPDDTYCVGDFENRFETEGPIVFGTAAFDGEQVFLPPYTMARKWGLENKVSSAIFPLAQFLKARRVMIMGFDFVGARFWEIDEDVVLRNTLEASNFGASRPAAHAAEQEDQRDVSLGFVKKWVDLQHLHQMEIYSVFDDTYTLINQVVPYISFDEALNL